MRTKSFKRVFLTLMIMVVLVTAIFGSGFKKANASDTNSFDNTNVMEDLRSSQNFNIFDYPAYKSTNPEIYIMNVVEYCYSVDENNRKNYGLYLYLYNPNGIEIDTGDNVNNVQIAVSYNKDGTPNDYEKFGLKFCSKSKEKYYENLFYKFKVNDHESGDGKTILQRVNSFQRRYDISGIEILEKGQTIHKEYGVGGCYTFKGYAKGYGADKKAESTLTCEVTNLETISLKTYSTYYRTGEYKENHRHDLTSVYFSVPDRYFDTYGNLQKIKATWYEYETTPVCVTSNQEVYDLLNPYLGKSTLETQDNFLQLYTGYQEMIGSSGHYDQYDWAYNCNYTDAVKEPCDRIAFLFSTNGEKISNYVVSSNLLRLYAVCYENSFETGYINVPGKQISHDLFEKTLSEKRASVNYVGDDVHHKLVEFDTDNTFDMLSYDDTHTGWQKFFAGLFGLAPNDVDVSYKGISPIKVVTEEDMGNSNLARHLLIDGESSSLNSFKTFYNQAKAKNEKVVLFRFAQTDYVNLPVMAYNNAKGENLSGDYGRDTYIVKESVFFNFDVIQLTFNKAGAYTVIPAVSSPIDVYNAITIPDNSNLEWWEIVLAIILAIILIILIWPAIPFLIKLIWWLICLPFKGLILLFKSIGKKIKPRKGNKEE